MTIAKQLDALTTFLSSDELSRQTALPLSLFPKDDQPQFVVPSIVIGTSGRTLQAINLVSKKLLCEIRVASSADARLDFDFAPATPVTNYRFLEFTHEIKQDDQVVASFEVAQIHVVFASQGVHVSLHFAGSKDEREAWRSGVLTALPLTSNLGAQNGDMSKRRVISDK
ncbi:MAG TPA: hypothetical protein VMI56_00650 [Reyranella sp.]|nr:hypothetical protein [Reyranella sp.]